MNQIRIIPLFGIPIIEKGDSISEIIFHSLQKNGIALSDGDIIVIAHTIVSKAEGRVVHRDEISLSDEAKAIAHKNGYDPYQVAIALEESQEVLRSDRALITTNKSNRISNFSGVDHSNAPPESYVLLPVDSDESAERIRENLASLTGKNVATVITDTEGRPWRRGAVNVALGCAGINAFKHNKGKRDLHGRILKTSMVCQIDELASAAELVTGQADEGIPVAVISGYVYEQGLDRGRNVNRPLDETLFK